MNRRLPALLALSAALTLSACGSEPTAPADTASSTSPSTSAPAADPSRPAIDFDGAPVTVEGITVSGTLDTKPVIEFTPGITATTLQSYDIVEGNGAVVEPGADLVVHYVGVGGTSGTQFDASWEYGTPGMFNLAGLIPGWQQGLPGMKEGGRRLLVIPGDLAYGDNSPIESIGKNETLIFVIDVLETSKPAQ